MCGIFAVYARDNVVSKNFELALSTQSHRGPDESSFVTKLDRHLHIGTNRLAIIDYEGGKQPKTSKSKNLTIAFNGEIFNSRELRNKLEHDGVIFSSDHSDTEVLLNGFEKYGEKFLNELNGMFAAIFFNAREKTLTLIKDRFGIKPLYYYSDNSLFVVASEIETILHYLKSMDRDISIRISSLLEYLQIGFITSPYTIYNGINSLTPGSFMDIDLISGEIKCTDWWKPDLNQWVDKTPEELPKLIKDEILKSVKFWSISDVPMAVSLSGGLDSSCLAIAAKELSIELNSYSLIFTGDRNLLHWDESENITKLSKFLGTEHHNFSMSPTELLEMIPSLNSSLGQPYGGGLPSWKIFSEISKSFRVCMTGTGGDEIFGNYNRSINISDKIIQNITKFDDEYTKKIYKSKSSVLKNLFPELNFEGPINNWGEIFEKNNGIDLDQKLALLNLKTQLSDELLYVTDRFSMKYSVEARTPYLDHNLVEKMLSVKAKYKSGLPYKELLYKSFEKELKTLNLNPNKKGFSLPLSIWLRNDLKDWAYKTISNAIFIEVLRPNLRLLNKLLDDLMNGNNDDILLIWRILMLSAWLEQNKYI